MDTAVQNTAIANLEMRRREGTYVPPQERFYQFGLKYRHDPVGFARDCIDWPEGESLTPYQEDALIAMVQDGRLAIRGPHGLGKSTTAAIAVIWFALVNEALAEAEGLDWLVLTTASGWAQLSLYLWPEIHKWAMRLIWEKIGCDEWITGRQLQVRAIKLKHGIASAIASNQPGRMEGAHAKRMLLVFDEAKEIPSATYDALEGASANAGPETGNEAYALAISTPGDSAGRFYDIHMRRPGYEDWTAQHVTLEMAIAAGRISRSWAERRARQWGEESAVYQRRVLGNFAQDSADAVIPLAWVEQSMERHKEWAAQGYRRPNGEPSVLTSIGVDVGGGEETGDASTIAYIYDYAHVGALISYPKMADPSVAQMELAGIIRQILEANQGIGCYVDIIGIGAGCVHRLREQKYDVRAYHAGMSTTVLDRSGEWGFVNWRAAGWWTLRECLDPTGPTKTMIPYQEDLIGELTATRRKAYTSKSQIVLESKEEIRKRLQGASPDRVDSIIHALAGPGLWQAAMATV